jgi:hypothetical protein
MSEQRSIENSEKLLKSVLFVNPKNSFQIFPIQFSEEEAILNLKSTLKDSTSALQIETITSFKFPITRKQYWKVTTSFYYSNLTNERVSSRGTMINDSLTRYNVVREDDTGRELGLSVMLKGGLKLARCSSWDRSSSRYFYRTKY